MRLICLSIFLLFAYIPDAFFQLLSVFNVSLFYNHMIPYAELHSRSNTILSFTYRASTPNGFALLLFTVLTLISAAVAAFFYVGNNEHKRHSRGKTFVDRFTM